MLRVKRSRQDRWTATCRKRYLGTFASAKDAALAFDVAAREDGGLPLNFPNERRTKEEVEQLRKGGTSKFRGVHWQCRRKTWMARYSIYTPGRKHLNLGAFAEERHAALAWDFEARRQGRGDAQLNFPSARPSEEEIDAWRVSHYKFFKSTSKYRGVSVVKARKHCQFIVQINVVRVQDALGVQRGHPVRVGEFRSEVAAAEAYDATCRECGVPERELNFPYGKKSNFRRCVDPRAVLRTDPPAATPDSER